MNDKMTCSQNNVQINGNDETKYTHNDGLFHNSFVQIIKEPRTIWPGRCDIGFSAKKIVVVACDNSNGGRQLEEQEKKSNDIAIKENANQLSTSARPAISI